MCKTGGIRDLIAFVFTLGFPYGSFNKFIVPPNTSHGNDLEDKFVGDEERKKEEDDGSYSCDVLSKVGE